VFVAAEDPHAVEQALAAGGEALGGGAVVGVSSAGVVASGRGTDEGTAVAVWAARIPEMVARPFHLDVVASPQEQRIVGLPGRRRDDVIAVLLADPWTFPVSEFAAHAQTLLTGLPVVGAVATGSGRRTTRFLQGGRIREGGAVGVMIGGRVEVSTLVSPACRPVGPALTVTDAEGFLVKSLAGLPAVQQSQEVVAALDPAERSLAMRGMLLGVAETSADPGVGDFAIHEFEAADERGALQTAAPVPVGATVQFHVLDQSAADEDLHVMLEGVAARMGGRLAGALMFSSSGRGRALFGSSDHDSSVAHMRLEVPVTGMFTTAELGPMGQRLCVNRQTATMMALGAGRHAVAGFHAATRPRRVEDVAAMDGELQEFLARMGEPPGDEAT